MAKSKILRWGVANKALFILSAMVPVCSYADFSGIYAPGNFVTALNGGSVDTTNAPNSIAITGANAGVPATTSVLLTAAEAGAYSFKWDYVTTDVDGPGFDRFGFVTNATVDQLSDNSGADSQAGTSTYSLSEGDAFGWQIRSTDGIEGAASVVISQFSFIGLRSTRLAVQENANGLRKVFAFQAASLNPGLSYDCSLFDKRGVCVAFSGRYTETSGSGAEATSGVLAGAYAISPTFRLGGFVEQHTENVSTSGVRLKNDSPDVGLFGVWSRTGDDEGLQVRGAYRYGNRDVSITRQVAGASEPGSGSTDLTSQGVQFTVSNGYRLSSAVLARPYLGVRYINITRGAYVESATTGVTTPLTYARVRQESTSVLLGVNADLRVSQAVSLAGAVGVEHDTTQNISNYAVAGLDGIGPIGFEKDTRATRAVASAGATYKIGNTQHISARVFYREEAFESISTTTGMLTYTAGF